MSDSEEKNFQGVGEGLISQIVDEHVEEVEESGKTVRRKGVYLLPNLFTTAALFAGFFAIISAMNEQFVQAAIAIFVAQVLDGFDGRVARMTNTESAFGVQYDSLSDMISFGVAPALVMFSWGLEPLGQWGWAAAFVFCACAALRLARFNTQAEVADNRYFVGLASPPAAALLAGVVWVSGGAEVSLAASIALAVLTAAAGLLMVSNVRYTSFKGLNLRGRVPFFFLLLGVFVFVLIVRYPSIILLGMAVAYAISGPAAWVFGLLRGKRGGVDRVSTDADDE